MILTVERAPLKVLGISGSVRRGSYNRALLEAAREGRTAGRAECVHCGGSS